jgi:hypothetical protein
MKRSPFARLRARLTSPWAAALQAPTHELIPLSDEKELTTGEGVKSDVKEVERPRLPYRCDWPNCNSLPYVEVYPYGDSWSYLCRTHFYLERFEYAIRLRAYPNLWCYEVSP